MKKNLVIVAGFVIVIAALLIWAKASRSVDKIDKANGLLGKSAPDFSLTDRDGNVYSLSSLKGKNILLFFSEGLICYPACWNEMIALGKDERFAAKNTEVLSVVVDAKESWAKAINDFPELKQAHILFDTDKRVSGAYGMLTAKSSMHTGSSPGHTYVLIDKDRFNTGVL